MISAGFQPTYRYILTFMRIIRLELTVAGFLMTITSLITSSISHLVIALSPCVLPVELNAHIMQICLS